MICTFAIGVRLIDFSKARDPSLVYDCGEADYANLLDGQGFNKVSFYDLKNEPKNNFSSLGVKLPSFMVVVPSDESNYFLAYYSSIQACQDFIQLLHSERNRWY